MYSFLKQIIFCVTEIAPNSPSVNATKQHPMSKLKKSIII